MTSTRLGLIGIIVVVLAAVWLLVLSGGSQAARGPVVLSQGDAGKTLSLHPGDTLDVVLDGNPSTGYSWEVLKADAAVVKLVGDPEFAAAGSMPGAAGKVTLHFQAVGAGQVNLQLVYHRAWEQDVPPEKSFAVTVVVR